LLSDTNKSYPICSPIISTFKLALTWRTNLSAILLNNPETPEEAISANDAMGSYALSKKSKSLSVAFALP
jgi:hypothetical protein